MKRVLMYILLILTAFMLQNNFFAAINWIKVTPNLLLIITFCFGFIRGKISGMAIGFGSGLLCDLFFGTSLGFYALLFVFIGYFNGKLGEMYYTEFINMPMVLCVVNNLAYSIYLYVFGMLINGAPNLGAYIVNFVLPETVYTLLITLIIYKPLCKLNAWMERIEKRSAKKFV